MVCEIVLVPKDVIMKEQQSVEQQPELIQVAEELKDIARVTSPMKELEIIEIEKEEVKEEVMTPGKWAPKVLKSLRCGSSAGKLGKLSKRPPYTSKKCQKAAKMPPVGKGHKLAKIGKGSKMPPVPQSPKIGKIAKIGKMSKRPPTPLKNVKVKNDARSSSIMKTGICLLSVRAAIVGQPQVQLPVWRPSVIPETSTVDKIIRLWAERTFGKSLSAADVPHGARCYAGSMSGKVLHRAHPLSKLKNKLPLVDGRLSVFIVWPLLEGMSLEDKTSSALATQGPSWIIKRRSGDGHTAIEKFGALVPTSEEERRKKRVYMCFANLNDNCVDPNCPYPHVRV